MERSSHLGRARRLGRCDKQTESATGVSSVIGPPSSAGSRPGCNSVEVMYGSCPTPSSSPLHVSQRLCPSLLHALHSHMKLYFLSFGFHYFVIKSLKITIIVRTLLRKKKRLYAKLENHSEDQFNYGKRQEEVESS